MGNLHLVTGYAGQAHITAEDHGSFNAAIMGSGNYVLDRGNKFSATVISNNSIRIYDGDILIQGRHVRLAENTYIDLTIENGAQGVYRNDLIVARYTKNTSTGIEECNLVVIKGTASTSAASDPEYSSGDIITEHATQVDFPLYRVPLNGLTVGTLAPLFDVIENLPAQLNKKSIKTTATIGTNWSGTSAPYTQSISISGVDANKVVEISLPSSATAEEVAAYQALNLQDGGQGNNSITLRAFGTPSTISIAVNVVVRGDF